MGRRRQKNPLLTRIVLISVAVHLVALPVLAHFGAFKKIQEHFVEAKIVVLAPPPSAPKQEAQKVARKAPPVVSKAKSSAVHNVGPKSAGNHPHLALASGPTGGDAGTSVDQGNGKVGVVPETQASSNPTPQVGAGNGSGAAKEPVAKNVVAAPTAPGLPSATTGHEKPIDPAPVRVAPHVPEFTEAAPIDGRQPQPSIPDDLRTDSLDTTVIVEVVVGADGVPTAATVSQSTGKQDLDSLAVDAAKRWRFRPATRDGVPIDSKVRLHIEFQVS